MPAFLGSWFTPESDIQDHWRSIGADWKEDFCRRSAILGIKSSSMILLILRTSIWFSPMNTVVVLTGEDCGSVEADGRFNLKRQSVGSSDAVVKNQGWWIGSESRGGSGWRSLSERLLRYIYTVCIEFAQVNLRKQVTAPLPLLSQDEVIIDFCLPLLILKFLRATDESLMECLSNFRWNGLYDWLSFIWSFNSMIEFGIAKIAPVLKYSMKLKI